MAKTFETSLLTRISSLNNRVRPLLSDQSFWSDVLMATPDKPPPPVVQYTLITDTGDELVDEFNNQFVAVS